jgi:anti-sigma-K factor RskA
MRSNHHIDRADDCDAVQELIPEYAFGLTAPADTRLVESSLAHCPDAASQLDEFRRLQEELRAGVPQFEPPDQLGARLVAAIAAPTRLPRARRRPVNLSRWLAAAAVIALIATNVYWLSRVDDLTRRQNELTSQPVGEPDHAFILASVSALRWVRLPPSKQNAGASAFMMWNGTGETGVLYVHGFPKLAVGRTYQLWLTRGEEMISAGTVRVDSDGKGALLFHTNQPIDKYTWARITLEPENGSNRPSDTVVVAGKLAA